MTINKPISHLATLGCKRALIKRNARSFCRKWLCEFEVTSECSSIFLPHWCRWPLVACFACFWPPAGIKEWHESQQNQVQSRTKAGYVTGTCVIGYVIGTEHMASSAYTAYDWLLFELAEIVLEIKTLKLYQASPGYLKLFYHRGVTQGSLLGPFFLPMTCTEIGQFADALIC